jgi:hypothetical protein
MEKTGYMKKLLVVFAAVVGFAVIGLVGCSKSGGGGVDTAKVESAFQAVAQADKAEVEKALTCVKSGDYSGALASLQKAAANVKLTPEQQQSLKDLVSQIQTKVADTAKQAVDDTTKAAKEGASKAADDLKKAVGK